MPLGHLPVSYSQRFTVLSSTFLGTPSNLSAFSSLSTVQHAQRTHTHTSPSIPSNFGLKCLDSFHIKGYHHPAPYSTPPDQLYPGHPPHPGQPHTTQTNLARQHHERDHRTIRGRYPDKTYWCETSGFSVEQLTPSGVYPVLPTQTVLEYR